MVNHMNNEEEEYVTLSGIPDEELTTGGEDND
jgi:hypothetical protein